MATGRGALEDPAKRFATGALPGVVLIGGTESFLVERAVAAIRHRLGVDADPESGRTVWADDPAERIAGALEDLGSPGLFGGTKLVVLRRAEALNAAAEARVLAAVEGPQVGHLVLVAGTIDRRKKLVQRLKGDACVEYAAVSDRHEMAAWVGLLAREAGLRVSSDGAEALMERCGSDLGRITSELAKLSYEHDQVGITEVRRSVAATRSHGIDELSGSLAAGDQAGVVRALRALLAEGEAPPRIVAFLAANLRRTLHVVELASRGLGEAAIASRLKIPGWMVRKQRREVSPDWCATALSQLCRLDRALKQSRAPAAVIEQAVVAITMPRSAERRRG